MEKNWEEQYYNKKIVELKKHFTDEEVKRIEKLVGTIENKIYTEYEFDRVELELIDYYKDRHMNREELKEVKSLKGTGVNREQYNKLMKKMAEISDIYHF